MAWVGNLQNRILGPEQGQLGPTKPQEVGNAHAEGS